MTQKDVAEVLGLNNSAMISRWEKGVTMPETLNALKMAALYRSSVDVIYHDLRLSVIDEISGREKVVVKARMEEYE